MANAVVAVVVDVEEELDPPQEASRKQPQATATSRIIAERIPESE
jgi:hypothetical protein